MLILDKLFFNLFYDSLFKKFILLKIQLFIIEYEGGLGQNLGKFLRIISKEMIRMLLKCKIKSFRGYILILLFIFC